MIPAMSIYRLAERVQSGEVYLGSELQAFQGSVMRNVYMLQTLRELAAARDREPLRILEIGSWAGGSALTWVEGLTRFNGRRGKVHCVDHWEVYVDLRSYGATNPVSAIFQKMIQAAASRQILPLFLHNLASARADDLVVVIRGDSREVLPSLRPTRYDLIYVDGGHTYPIAHHDIRVSRELLRSGGILCGDDLELELDQCDPEAARRSQDLEYSVDPRTGGYLHPGVTLAVAELVGPVSCWHGFWAARKTGSGFEKIDLDVGDLSIPRHFREAMDAGALPVPPEIEALYSRERAGRPG